LSNSLILLNILNLDTFLIRTNFKKHTTGTKMQVRELLGDISVIVF